MKKIVTFAAVAAGALALSACGGKTEEAPEAEPTVDAMAEETPAVDPAEAAAEGLDPTGNPIPPAASDNPIPPEGEAGAEAAPAAE